ncbi:hypothetical protein NDU88_000768 [Pleurodeles waltl]|uniref:Uncharacterized protein n=1 Tax=Pleurodeles waltl TaxID=8319 RepID=A0AAV7R574_PLEWA|nr:hypothetical protein NDU88_000768 [Pleurodeles waltl]
MGIAVGVAVSLGWSGTDRQWSVEESCLRLGVQHRPGGAQSEVRPATPPGQPPWAKGLLRTGSMPLPFLLLRTLLIRLAGSRLAASGVQFLRKRLTWAGAHLALLLRRVWRRATSEQSRQAVLGCVLCLLNLGKKVDGE